MAWKTRLFARVKEEPPLRYLIPRPLNFSPGLERVTRLELATSSLARRCSTTELHPQLERDEIMSTPLRDATL
jgi:hypothetical protein